MTDADTQEWREATIEWAEQIHREVRSVRVMVQVMFVVWLVGLALAVVGLVIAAD
jgi:hypothetical protein